MLSVERIDDLETLADEWDDLAGDRDAAGFYTTREWLFPWWRRLGGAGLCAAALRDHGQLIAVAPFYLRPARLDRQPSFACLDLIGAGEVGSDYLDVIVRRGHEASVLPVLADWLAGEARVLAPSRLATGSFVGQLAETLTGRGWTVVERPEESAPVIRLAGRDFEDYLATLGTAHRYAFRRRLRELERDFHVELELVTGEDRRWPALADLIAMHRARWGSRSEAFVRPALVGFHDEVSRLAAARGWLRLYILHLDGRPAAGLYAFRYHDVFYYVQSGFASEHGGRSVGLVLLGMVIRAAFAEGAAEFDLGHGDDGYKHHWARGTRELRRFEVYPPGARGWLHRQTADLERRARRLLRGQVIRADKKRGSA